MNLWNALDFVPIVGTAKNTLEGIGAALLGDEDRAAEKLTSALVGGTLDVLTLGAGSSLLKLGAKGGVKMVAVKGGVKMVAKKGVLITGERVACNVAGRVAYGTVSDAMGRPHVTYEDLANIRYQNRHLWGQDDDDDGDRRNNQNQRSSKRGEHVINNNVLKLYRDVVRTFVNDVMNEDLDTMIER